MKINIDARLQEAVDSGKSFAEQLATARASGRPFGTVYDMVLGQHVIYTSPEEIADTQARAVVEAAKPAPKSAGMIALDAIKADPAALAALKAALA